MGFLVFYLASDKSFVKTEFKQKQDSLLIIKMCHACGHVVETNQEPKSCEKCSKAFLPLQYFNKVHDKSTSFDELFSTSEEIDPKDIIKGLYVIW